MTDREIEDQALELALAIVGCALLLLAAGCGPAFPLADLPDASTPDARPSATRPAPAIDDVPGLDAGARPDSAPPDSSPPDASQPDAYYDPLGVCKESILPPPDPPVLYTCARTSCAEACAEIGQTCTWQCDLLFGGTFAGLALYRGTGDQCGQFGCPAEWLHETDCSWVPPETSPAGFQFHDLACCCY